MSKQIEITHALAMAAAQDAGNRHMRAGRRTKWAVADWNHARETFAQLWPQEPLRSSEQDESGAGRAKNCKDCKVGKANTASEIAEMIERMNQ